MQRFFSKVPCSFVSVLKMYFNLTNQWHFNVNFNRFRAKLLFAQQIIRFWTTASRTFSSQCLAYSSLCCGWTKIVWKCCAYQFGIIRSSTMNISHYLEYSQAQFYNYHFKGMHSDWTERHFHKYVHGTRPILLCTSSPVASAIEPANEPVRKQSCRTFN